jgi:hypothetical protein
LLSWKWDNQGNATPEDRILRQEKLLACNIKIGNVTNLLKQKEVFDAHKTLGTYKCLVGNELEHILSLKEKSDDMGIKSFRSQLDGRQSKTSYKSCYIP